MEIFKLFGRVLVDSSEAENSISKTGQKAEGLGSKLGTGIKTAAKWGAALVAAAAAAGAALFGLSTKAAATTDEIDKMSQKIGISREAYQEMAFVMSQSGTDVNLLQNGVKTLTNQMQAAAEGSKVATSAFEALGLSVYDSAGNFKDQETMMFEAIAALQAMDDQTQKAALAVDLFGRAGTELMPMLNGASGSIESMRQQAHDLGLVISDEAVDAGVKFTDTMDQLKRAFSATGTVVGAELMPLFTGMAEWVIAQLPVIQEKVGILLAFIQDGIAALQAFWEEHGAQITEAVRKVWEIISDIISKAMDVIKAVINTVMAIINGDWESALAGMKDIAQKALELIATLFSTAMEALVGIVNGIAGALWSAGEYIFTSLWDGLKSVWTKVSNWVSEKVEWLADKLTFWKTSTDEMSGEIRKGTKSDGSHASGLAYVPYDGYRAELHKGETIRSAGESKSMVEDIVNAISAVAPSGQGRYIVEIPVIISGKELYRLSIDDLRSVMKSSPEVVSDL